MAISDLANRPTTPVKKGPDCAVCRALADLPDAEANALRSMLADKQRRFIEIARDIAEDPDPATPDYVRAIAAGTYRRHARGECSAREKLR